MHQRSSLTAFLSSVALGTIVLLPPASAMRWPPDNGTAASSVQTTGRPSSRTRKPPRAQYMQSQAYRRNQQRRDDVNTIAVYLFQYRTDHNQDLPPGIPLKEPKEICRMGAKSCKGLLDLGLYFSPYTSTIPVDPQQPTTDNGTGYAISQDFKGKATVISLHPEEAWIIKTDK